MKLSNNIVETVLSYKMCQAEARKRVLYFTGIHDAVKYGFITEHQVPDETRISSRSSRFLPVPN